MANIKIFGYTNKEGTESWKVLLMVGESATHFGGISLGKALLSEHASSKFEDIIEAGVAFDTLDHLPRKGEGLPQFNDCYKMFAKTGVSFTLAEIPAAQVLDDVDGFKKAVEKIKGAEPSALKKTIETKEAAEGIDSEVIGAVSFLGGISIGSYRSELSGFSSSIDFEDTGDEHIGASSGSSLSSNDGEKRYSTMYADSDTSNDKVADALKVLAEALGYKITISK